MQRIGWTANSPTNFIDDEEFEYDLTKDPPAAIKTALDRSTRRWRLQKINTTLPGVVPDDPDIVTPPEETDLGKTTVIDFASSMASLKQDRASTKKVMHLWTPPCYTALVSAVSGGQWTQARKASVKQWELSNLCQLCKGAVGTLGHRFECPETKPRGGWPIAPMQASRATSRLPARRQEFLQQRGMLAIRVHTPRRHKEGWFEWEMDPGETQFDHQWYIDGSAINPRWRSLTTTGFGIVVVNAYGELIGYGRGAPPEWIRTAAAAEAWALLIALSLSLTPPKIATDCKGLVDTAARGAHRATAARQPLARIWNAIASCLDGNTQQIAENKTLRWIPAHLTEAAVGTVLPCGNSFSVTDWRANRLADMLAKSVARQNAVPPQVEEYVKSACVAAHHACALLGVVALAANSREVTKFRLDGTTFVNKSKILLLCLIHGRGR